MKLLKSFLVCGALGLMAAATLPAQPAPNCPTPGQGPGCWNQGPGRGRMGGRMAAALKLTDAQVSRINAIKASHAVALNARRQALQDARKAYHQACQNPASTLEQLKALHQPVADREFELMQAQRAQRLEVRTVLTPEQQAEADKLCQTMGPGRGRGKGMGMGMGCW